jgi:predicted amidohydrolase
VLEIVIGGQAVGVGIQLCREIRFPVQWRYLARGGAEVFAYLTNAVGDESGMQAGVWRSHLVSRAAENQRYVLAANNAGEGQKCPSMIVAPDGRVLWEVISTCVEMNRREIELSEVADWYLSQARDDVVGFG